VVLLDANVLIALLWPAHEHHARASAWFAAARSGGWCTCALTQAALVRVMSQPAFHAPPLTIDDAATLLTRNTVAADHRYLPITFQMVDVLRHCTGGVVGYRQVTDAWLITLAAKHGAKLATLDQRLHALLATPEERARDLTLLPALKP
jgi:uncharacterized protein